MRLTLFVLIFKISIISGQEIQNDIFGFATSNTFTFCDVEDTFFINKVQKINPQILRFPGGAVGNFYHFGKSGYGFDFAEIDKFHNGKFPKRARGLENKRKKNKDTHDYIDDFIVLAKETCEKAVLVANPFNDDDSDIILMIEKLHKNNIQVVGVELGSELSNRSYFLNGYTIDDYISFAQRCSKNIKNKFPSLKTAVVAAPLGKKKGHRHNIWNTKLAALDFYDAIIIHSYAKVTKGKSLDGQMVSEEVETSNKSEAFEMYKYRTVNYFKNIYANEVQEYSNIYKKPIWVTEWNLQISKITSNTLLQGLFVAQYLLEVFTNPKFSSIELTTFHNLGGRDFGGSIFRNNQKKIEIQSTFYPMMMIGKIFENNVEKIEKENDAEILRYKCYNKDSELVLIYQLDWELYQFSCHYNFSASFAESIVYKSSNLFDISDNLGLIERKIYEPYE